MPTLRDLVIELIIMMAVGLVLAALGPFGSFAIGSFGERLAYWIPVALIGYAIFRPITLAAVLVARWLALSEIVAAAVGALLAAIPGSWAIAYLGGYTNGELPRFDELFQLYVQVALVGVMVVMLFILIERGSISAASPSPQATPTSQPSLDVTSVRFLDRLPEAWRDRLVALEMEDHYVRAHGPDSSALILLRMGDAEAELIGIEGLRVHRSWWVARSAVKRAVRNGRSYKLLLTNGLEAPVARDRLAALKEARWIG